MTSTQKAEKLNPMKMAIILIYALSVGYASLSPASGISVGDWDKLAHFLTYGLFAVLAYWVVKDSKARLLVCIAIVIYSGLIEVGQSFVPGRFMSGYDFLANTLGVIIGAITVRFLAPSVARN